MNTVPKRASVDTATSALSRAAEHLAIWRTDTTATGVIAGHNALTAIDEALRALTATRDRLVGEIRADQDAAAVRVDALLARTRRDLRGSAVAQLLARGGEAA